LQTLHRSISAESEAASKDIARPVRVTGIPAADFGIEACAILYNGVFPSALR
jgi:hypothetical protein